ncbi:MAG: MlaD family protein [Planctomycetota bacterium]
MDENRLKFGVGVLVIAAIGIGIILTFLFGAFPAVLAREYSLTVWFESAEGVNTNTPVLRDGVKIGRVSDIQLRAEGGVLLSLAMESNHPMTHHYIPQIGIGSLITGDAQLEFKKAEPELLNQIFAADPDMVEKVYSEGEYFAYGKKVPDPFSVLFGMENELVSAFQSVRGAGDAIKDIASSIDGLVRDVRGVIGVPMTPRNRSGSLQRVDTSVRLASMPAAPDWVVHNEDETTGMGSAGGTSIQQVAMQIPQGGFGVPGGQAVVPVTPNGSLDAVAQAEPTIRDLTAEAIETLDEFQSAVRDVRAIIGDAKLQDDLKRAVGGVPSLLDAAGETLQVTQDTFDSFRDVGEQFEQVGVVAEEAVVTVRDTVESFQATVQNVENFTEPLGQRGGELIDQVLESLANLDEVLVQVGVLGRTINNSDGTFRRILEDEELYYRIKRSVENIEAATARVRPILDDVRVFTDKIARDPRQLGVRGALTRQPNGMGLK